LTLLPVVGSKVIVYSSSAVWLEAEHVSLKVTKSVTEALDSAAFTLKKTLPANKPEIGQEVKIWIKAKAATEQQVFRGYIETIDSREEGQEITYICKAHQLPAFKFRTVSLGRLSASQDYIIKKIVKPLTDDGIITVTNVAVLGSTVVSDRVKDKRIWNTLKSFLVKNQPLVDVYLDYNNDLHAYYKVDTPLSSETLDYTDPNASKILNIQYVEDIEPVRNSITILGANKIVEKNNNKDYFTESVTNWTGEWVNTSEVWTSVTPVLDTDHRTAGTASVSIVANTYPYENIRGMRLTLNTSDLNIPRLEYGAVFKVDIRYYNAVWTWYGFEVPFSKCRVVISFYDTNGAWRWFERFIDASGAGWEHWATLTAKVGPNSPDLIWGSGEFDWTKLQKIVIEVRNSWLQDFDWIGEACWKTALFVDKLYFDECYAYSTYEITDSVNKYDKRPYLQKTSFPTLETDSECLQKAKSLIEPIAYPEKSIKSVTITGNELIVPWNKIYVKTKQVDGTYYIRKVEHVIDENFRYNTKLELSTSFTRPPEKTEEETRIEIYNRILDLEEKLDNLERAFKIRTEIPRNIGAVKDIQEIDWSGPNWDWSTIPTGIAQMSIAAINQMLAGGATVWKYVIQALGTPFLNLFPSIGENMVYNGEFELDSDGDNIPDGWTTNFETTGGGTANEGLTSTIKQEGTYSYYMSCTTTQGDSIASAVIPVQPGKTYVFRCRARSNVATSKGFYFRVLWYANKTNIARGDAIAFGDIAASEGLTTTFQEFSGQLTAPSGAYFARIACYNWLPDVDATFYFDSIWMFKEISWPEMIQDYLLRGITGLRKFGEDLLTGLLGLPTHNMLFNPSFEYDRNNDGCPDHWGRYSLSVQRSTDWVKEGKYSVKMSTTATSYGGFVHTHLPNRQGHTYVWRAYWVFEGVWVKWTLGQNQLRFEIPGYDIFYWMAKPSVGYIQGIYNATANVWKVAWDLAGQILPWGNIIAGAIAPGGVSSYNQIAPGIYSKTTYLSPSGLGYSSWSGTVAANSYLTSWVDLGTKTYPRFVYWSTRLTTTASAYSLRLETDLYDNTNLDTYFETYEEHYMHDWYGQDFDSVHIHSSGFIEANIDGHLEWIVWELRGSNTPVIVKIWYREVESHRHELSGSDV